MGCYFPAVARALAFAGVPASAGIYAFCFPERLSSNLVSKLEFFYFHKRISGLADFRLFAITPIIRLVHLRRYDMYGRFQMKGGENWLCRNRSMQTGSFGTLIDWKSCQTTFVPLWDRMEGAWLRTLKGNSTLRKGLRLKKTKHDV